MVKVILKQNGITLIQFSNDLNLSRPTVDSYIKSYDENGTVPSQLYQKIFDFLFSGIDISNAEFLNKYEYVKTYYGNKEKNLYEIRKSNTPSEDIEEADYGSNMVNELIYYLQKFKHSIPLDKIVEILTIVKGYVTVEAMWRNDKYIIFRILNEQESYKLCMEMPRYESEIFENGKKYLYENMKYIEFCSNSDINYLKAIANTLNKK